MRWCLGVKLIQNFDKFSSLLLKTTEKPIVGTSSKDKIWGASPTQPGILIGVNALGRLLMELRKKVNDGTLHANSVIQPIDIPGLLLFNNLIKPVHNHLYYLKDFADI